MVLTPLISLKSNQTLHFSTLLNHNKPIKTTQKLTIINLKLHSNQMGRRKLSSFSLIFTTTTSFSLQSSTKEEAKAEAAVPGPGPFDFLRMTVPGQTKEQADAVIKDHALSLLQVKELLEDESWKDAQRELRRSSAQLKQDLYTIIQGKPGIERPPLRELYSKLFNSVTRLDFAARDKDVTLVKECYGNMVDALNEVFSVL